MSSFRNPPCELDEEFVTLLLEHQPQQSRYLSLYGEYVNAVRVCSGGMWFHNAEFMVYFGEEGATPLLIPVM